MLWWSGRLLVLAALLTAAAAALDTQEIQKEEEEYLLEAGRGPPENVAVVEVLTNALNVSWDPPGEEPSYYTVEAGTNNEVTHDTFFFIEGLQPCTHYSIIVTSVYEGTGEAYPAYTDSYTDISVPPAPPSCWFVNIDTTSLTAYWSDPHIQCPVTNHNVSWTSHVLWNDEEDTSGVHQVPGDHYSVKPLKPYTNVTVSVAAATEAGYGPSTSCWNVTLQDIPGPPVITNVTSYEHSLYVSWSPPEEANGVILHYVISIENDNFKSKENVTGSVYSTSFSDIPLCEVYDVTVQATTEAGSGPPDTTRIQHNGAVPPSSVTCDLGGGGTEPTVCWTPLPRECLDDLNTLYDITWKGDVLWSSDTDEGSGSLPWSEEPQLCYTAVTSVPYTNYSLCVGVDGHVTDTGCCSVQTPQAVPGRPVIQDVTASVGSAVVTWTPPGEANGIITEYIINAVSGEDSVSTSVDGTVLTSVLDLEDCQTYDITVQASTEAGWGPVSEAWTITTSGPSPRPPELCWFSNITHSKMVVNWIDPVTQCGLINNHSISWSWDVLWADEQGSNVTFSQDTSITLTDLQPYTNVTAQVAAVTEGGVGPPTSCWNVTSPDRINLRY